MAYQRTEEQRRHDLANAKSFENYVAEEIGVPVHTRFTSKEMLDLWHPGYMVEIKEKNQSYGNRWHLLEGTEERDLFILDELTVRKALKWFPEVFFLIRDNVGGNPDPRLFFIPIWEVISVPKSRVDREHHLGALKGKWIIDLSMFTRITDIKEIPELAHHMLVEQVWKRPQCLGGLVGQV